MPIAAEVISASIVSNHVPPAPVFGNPGTVEVPRTEPVVAAVVAFVFVGKMPIDPDPPPPPVEVVVVVGATTVPERPPPEDVATVPERLPADEVAPAPPVSVPVTSDCARAAGNAPESAIASIGIMSLEFIVVNSE